MPEFSCLLQSCCGGGSSLQPPHRHQGSNPRLQDADGGLQMGGEAATRAWSDAAVRRSRRRSIPGGNWILYPLVNEEKRLTLSHAPRGASVRDRQGGHAVGCPAPSTANWAPGMDGGATSWDKATQEIQHVPPPEDEDQVHINTITSPSDV